jgi:hypothetical protein
VRGDLREIKVVMLPLEQGEFNGVASERVFAEIVVDRWVEGFVQEERVQDTLDGIVSF